LKGGDNMNLPINKVMVVRTILFVLAWFNQYLVTKGNSPLPFDNAQLEVIVSSVFTFVVSMWAYWKNNNVTRKARLAALKTAKK